MKTPRCFVIAGSLQGGLEAGGTRRLQEPLPSPRRSPAAARVPAFGCILRLIYGAARRPRWWRSWAYLSAPAWRASLPSSANPACPRGDAGGQFRRRPVGKESGQKQGGAAPVREGWRGPRCLPGSVPRRGRARGCRNAPAASPRGTAPGQAAHGLLQGRCPASPAAVARRGRSAASAEMAAGWSLSRRKQDQACGVAVPMETDAGCCRAELRAAPALGAGARPRPPGRRALEREAGGPSPIAVLSEESGARLFGGKNGNVIRSACIAQIENQF